MNKDIPPVGHGQHVQLRARQDSGASAECRPLFDEWPVVLALFNAEHISQ